MADETIEDAELLDALDVGFIVLNREGKIDAWNAWMASASGISCEAARGKSMKAVFSGSTLGRLQVAIDSALSSGATSLITHVLHPRLLPLRTPAGQELIHNVSVRAVSGQAPRCAIQVFDVTGATRRERVLRERQNARYDAVVLSAPDGILTLAANGAIQQANPAAARSFGYEPRDFVGQAADFLFEDPRPWNDLLAALAEGETQVRPRQLVGRRKDGSPNYVEASASLWVSDGRSFVTVILRDVNEQRAAEFALRALNENLEERVDVALAERKILADIVETTDAIVQVVDRDFRILAINQPASDEAEHLFGVRPKIGDSYRELISNSPIAEQVESLWNRALTGEAFTSIQTFPIPGREQRYYEMKFEVLTNDADEQIGAYQFVYDVTDRVDRETQLAVTQDALRQSQKMEAIGQLTGGIAHDFNNLLTGIIGAMDILKRRFAAGRYDDVQRFMDAAVTSANRAAALTHRLLAFARRQPLDPKPVDVNHLIRGTEELLSRTLGEQVAFKTELEQDVWKTLSDPYQLENAVLNLAINARDAMPTGGRLTISTANVANTTPITSMGDDVPPGEYVAISVADTGTGMSAETAAKVFEPFFTTKPIGQGTGLGLSMIYGFAKQTRGHIGLESALGAGTRISLYLPRFSGGAVSNDLGDSQATPEGQGETVLLIEDDPSVRLLIGEVLRELGYACIEAIDGQAALPVLASNARIDLMITDVGLPGLNGRQVAEIARQSRPMLKVLFVTGYAEHATGSSNFLEPGMQMVTKPFTLDALAMKIRDMIAPRINE